jgi:hypothetical protein
MKGRAFLPAVIFSVFLMASLANSRVVLARPAMRSDGERLVARDASLTLLVEDIDQALKALETTAVRFGGYVASKGTFTLESGGKMIPGGSLTIQVPSDQFNPGILAVRSVGMAVLEEKTSGTDRTDEIVDLESQVRALEADQQRLEEIGLNAASDAENQRIREDLLAVMKELSLAKENLQNLRRGVEWAEIYIKLVQFIPTPTPTLWPTEAPTSTPIPWNPQASLERALNEQRRGSNYCLCISICLAGIAALAYSQKRRRASASQRR